MGNEFLFREGRDSIVATTYIIQGFLRNGFQFSRLQYLTGCVCVTDSMCQPMWIQIVHMSGGGKRSNDEIGRVVRRWTLKSVAREFIWLIFASFRLEIENVLCEECNGFVRSSHKCCSSFGQKQYLMEHGKHLTRWLVNRAQYRCALFG